MKKISNYSSFVNETLYMGKKFSSILGEIGDNISLHLLSARSSDVIPAFNLLKISDKNSNLIDFTSGINKIKFKTDDYPAFYTTDNFTDEKIDKIVKWFNDRNPKMNLMKDQIANRDEANTIIRNTEYRVLDTISIRSLHKLDIFGVGHIQLVLAEGSNTYVFLRKYDDYGPEGESERPSSGRIGRVIRRILTDTGFEFTDKQVEEFVNKFKSKVEALNNSNIDVVNGKDIKKYYHLMNNNSSNRGTLGSSCMRYPKCQRYLEIYSENPDQVELVILRNGENTEKIDARALLWTTTDGEKFMDRVYYTWDYQAEMMKDYALKNGWMCKTDQDSSQATKYIIPENGGTKEEWKRLDVILDNVYFDFYPYADTMKCLNLSDHKISNESNGHDGYLESTWGGLDEDDDCPVCNGNDEITCDECDGDGYVDCDDCTYGSNDCDTCDGEGQKDCPHCDGEGEVEIDCAECEGRGYDIDNEEEECSYCDGEGTVKVECSEINGEDCNYGQVECEDCHGEGSIECHSCGGGEQLECSDCDGDGYTYCPNCN